MLKTAASRFPIALFPVLLGVMGMGLALRRAEHLGVPAELAQLWLGMGSALLLVSALFYAAKIAMRPGALIADLAPPPARAAFSALGMGLMLAGAALAPILFNGAAAVWVLGVVVHWIGAGVMIRMLTDEATAKPKLVPGLYLVFVGQIVAPYGGVALGYSTLSLFLFASALAAWAVLGGLLARAALKTPESAPYPFRPGHAIHLAPPAVGAGAAMSFGAPWAEDLALVLTLIAIPIAVFLVSKAKWLTEGGWNPAWGAFTFPSAAFAGALVAAARTLDLGPAGDAAALLAVAIAAGIVLRVFVGAMQALRAGKLAPKVPPRVPKF